MKKTTVLLITGLGLTLLIGGGGGALTGYLSGGFSSIQGLIFGALILGAVVGGPLYLAKQCRDRKEERALLQESGEILEEIVIVSNETGKDMQVGHGIMIELKELVKKSVEDDQDILTKLKQADQARVEGTSNLINESQETRIEILNNNDAIIDSLIETDKKQAEITHALLAQTTIDEEENPFPINELLAKSEEVLLKGQQVIDFISSVNYSGIVANSIGYLLNRGCNENNKVAEEVVEENYSHNAFTNV